MLGLVGTNGIGKSTALKVLSGKLKPNLGDFEDTPDWETILQYFRGSELQNYFTKIVEDNLKATLKPQYVDHIPRAVRGSVKRVRVVLVLNANVRMWCCLDTSIWKYPCSRSRFFDECANSTHGRWLNAQGVPDMACRSGCL